MRLMIPCGIFPIFFVLFNLFIARLQLGRINLISHELVKGFRFVPIVQKTTNLIVVFGSEDASFLLDQYTNAVEANAMKMTT